MIDESQSIALKHVQFCVGQICEEPVCKFLACLEQHALVRELSSSTFYWVCAYANNQHCVEEDIKSNPRSTSFYRAMQMSEGVLLVLDSAGTPFGKSMNVSTKLSARQSSLVSIWSGAKLMFASVLIQFALRQPLKCGDGSVLPHQFVIYSLIFTVNSVVGLLGKVLITLIRLLLNGVCCKAVQPALRY